MTAMPELTLTIAALREHDACDLDARIADMAAHLGRAPADDEPIPLSTWWLLPSTSIPDRWWSLRAAEPELAARRLGVRAACRTARRMLHLMREQDRDVCLAAIEAAEAWAKDPTGARVDACRRATRAARAAAYAVADAYADAYAARTAAYYAARTAAYAAADAAAADAAYSDAAAAAADADEREKQRADLDELILE